MPKSEPHPNNWIKGKSQEWPMPTWRSSAEVQTMYQELQISRLGKPSSVSLQDEVDQ